MRAGDLRRPQVGFTYVLVLAAVALLGLALAALGPMWAEEARRSREAELLRVGQAYAEAIASYREASPGSVRQYPRELGNLLVDTRFVGMKRHLRKLYADPLSPGRPWGVIRAADGGIRGVYSLDTRSPLRKVPLRLGVVELPAAQTYVEWKFMPSEPR